MILQGEVILHLFNWAIISGSKQKDWELYKLLRSAEKFTGLYADNLRGFLIEWDFYQALKRRDSIK